MVALVLTSLAVPNAPAAIVYDLVTVGNAGNAADTTTYGGVAYEYQIGKYDVTIGQYTEFLNAVAATDPYSLYNANMFFDGNIKGIQRGGSPTAFDRILGSRFGVKAVELIRQGRYGKMVSLQGRNIVDVPLADGVGQLKTVPREYYDMAEVFFG